MKKNRVVQVSFFAIFAMLLALLGGATTVAQDTNPPDQADVVAVTITADEISWVPQIESGGYTLTISGPGDFYLSQTYQPGDRPVFRAEDRAGQALPAGVYQYEFRFVPLEKPAERDGGAGDRAPVTKAPVQSGSFSILDGSFVLQNVTEDADEGGRTSDEGAPAPYDQVILDDLIVDGSACIGFDCVNGESFGFDTLRLKENNLRIRFQDTSNSGSFPTTDWQLVANDSSNGGANYFAIQDADAGQNVFVVEASAGSNALYVDDAGRIGIGTNSPVVEVQINDGDTPTVRLNQDGTGGWSPQIWDVAGNESNFFIRDVTNGSRLSFRIKPGAPQNSLFIASDGGIGLGTDSPDGMFDVDIGGDNGHDLFVSDGGYVGIGTGSPDDGGGAERFLEVKSGSNSSRVVIDSADGTGKFGELLFQRGNGNEWSFGNENSQFYIYNYGLGEYALTIDTATDNVTIEGDLTINGQCTEVDGACAPDYVFEPNYELLTLQELRAYITEYEHLPNVPDAAEIEANGINMRAFNFALLEKIEELTLYTLEQQAIIDELMLRIEALEGQ